MKGGVETNWSSFKKEFLFILMDHKKADETLSRFLNTSKLLLKFAKDIKSSKGINILHLMQNGKGFYGKQKMPG